MQKITPFIWFEKGAEDAVDFYVSVFKDAKILNQTRYDEATAEVAKMPAGSVMVISFEILGQSFSALNGGPGFPLSGGISFAIYCDTQEEVDYYWEKLGEGGKYLPCGWLTDKFGVTWQVVPKILDEMMLDPNKEKVRRVTEAMLKMGKLEIEPLKRAYEAEE